MKKIHNEIDRRDQSLTDMEKRRNTMSMLSAGSKKILEKSQIGQQSMKFINLSPSTICLDIYSDKLSMPTSSQLLTNRSKVHERLYQEKNILDLKRGIMKQEQNIYSYRNFCNLKSFTNQKILTNRSLKSLSEAVGVNSIPYSNHHKTQSLQISESLSTRLKNLKSAERTMRKEVQMKRSPKEITNKLYDDALKRRTSKERGNFYNAKSTNEYQNQKSKQFTISRLIENFNEACNQSTTDHSKEEMDFLNVFEMMKKLGFVRQKENISQAEINSDKALFMDFWQYLDENKKNKITKDLLLAFCLAIENFDFADVFKDKNLQKIYYEIPKDPERVQENKLKNSLSLVQIREEVPIERQAYLSKSQIINFHQIFLLFARNRSMHLKTMKMNKYKERYNYDNNLRIKPSLTKNSLRLARKIKSQYTGANKIPYCEIRKKSLEKKKFEIQNDEDQIGGQAIIRQTKNVELKRLNQDSLK